MDQQPHQAPHHKALTQMKKGNSIKSWQAGLCSLLLLPAMVLAEPGFWHASKEGRNRGSWDPSMSDKIASTPCQSRLKMPGNKPMC